MKKTGTLISVIVLISAIIVGGIYLLLNRDEKENDDENKLVVSEEETNEEFEEETNEESEEDKGKTEESKEEAEQMEENEEPERYKKQLTGKTCEKYIITCEDDIEGLKEYDSIGYLKIDSADIQDFSFLQNVKMGLLQILHNEYPVDLSYVDSDYVTGLYFHDVEFVDYNEFSKFKFIEEFHMLHNKLTEYENMDYLSDCRLLTKIDLHNCNISDINFMENMKKLINVSVINSSVKSLEPLKNCRRLKDVAFESAKIEDVSPIKEIHLYSLNLRDNYITDISSLKTMIAYSLCDLDLSQNFISDVSMLEPGEDLNMNFAHNYITSLPETIGLGKTADFSYNNISQIVDEQIQAIKDSEGTLNIFDNPLSEETMKKLDDTGKVFYRPYKGGNLDCEQAIKYNSEAERISEICKSEDDYQTVYNVYRYTTVGMGASYDYSLTAENKDNCYGAMFGKSVCTGITEASLSLLRRAGIKAKEYNGDYEDTNSDERHVWTLVNVYDKWYHCDSTLSNIGEIVLFGDEAMKEYAYILDCANAHPCLESISQEKKQQLHENRKIG